MFWEGGHLYVYFTYGMHFCANVVTGSEGTGNAVLLRALEPLDGVRIMAENRKRDSSEIKDLCSGPAKLCQAFGIARSENGTDVCGRSIWIESDTLSRRSFTIEATPRVGISQGKDALLRFVLRPKKTLSGG